MSNIKIESILLTSGKGAEENTWKRYHKKFPNIIREGSNIIIRDDSSEVILGRFEEAVLSTILEFYFSPVWLINQFLQRNGMEIDSSITIIKKWINIGLVWVEPSITGEYLRPTFLLFKVFGKPNKSFSDIPFNQLTHTVSEEKIYFDVMSGDKDFVVNRIFGNTYIPRFSPLGLSDVACPGTNVICETQFSSVLSLSNKDAKFVNNMEAEINQGISEGKSITAEFNDFSKFMIVQKIDNTGEVKSDYKFHIPDLIIPIPRKSGVAQSIAIEAELSNKGPKRYRETLVQFKNNTKFGVVVWLSNSGKISQNLKKAFEDIGGLGSTKMAIYEFNIPYPNVIFK